MSTKSGVHRQAVPNPMMTVHPGLVCRCASSCLQEGLLLLNISDTPAWLIFPITVLIIGLMIELGFRLGFSVQRKTEDEKESSVSAVTASVLALLAFILAFTFGIVSDRYDARKALVREQAITISTAYARTDFLPDADRTEAQDMFRSYMDALLAAAEQENSDARPDLIAEMNQINTDLWAMGVEHARQDPGSEMIGLYMDSLNSMSDVQALRDAVALQAKIPNEIWIALYALILLAMVAIGYQTAIAKSRRSWTLLLLALSFSTVVALIAVLDNPDSRILHISQQPLIQVQESMTEEPAT